MNVHDSRRIDEVLREHGYEPTDEPTLADLVVFNTCSVREKAEHKLRSAVGTYRPLKDARPGLVIAIAGCVAQQRQEVRNHLLNPENVDLEHRAPRIGVGVFDECRVRRTARYVDECVDAGRC
jgi:tRNA A37 methylthiotransferase MiaB